MSAGVVPYVPPKGLCRPPVSQFLLKRSFSHGWTLHAKQKHGGRLGTYSALFVRLLRLDSAATLTVALPVARTPRCLDTPKVAGHTPPSIQRSHEVLDTGLLVWIFRVVTRFRREPQYLVSNSMRCRSISRAGFGQEALRVLGFLLREVPWTSHHPSADASSSGTLGLAQAHFVMLALRVRCFGRLSHM